MSTKAVAKAVVRLQTSLNRNFARSHHTRLKRPHVWPRHVQHHLGSFRITPSHVRKAGSFAHNARTLVQQHPVSVAVAVVAMLAGSGCILYANYLYQSYILQAFHKYPEPVAQKLRRALYYTNTSVDPQEAVKYYRQALEVAQEIGMDPFSDEIIGIKIQVAALMEKIRQYNRAIEVLERVRSDNLTWLERFDKVEEKKLQRTNVLAKTIGISVKLGDLYGQPAIYDQERAEERLVWAVETVLKEQQRRHNSHVREDDEGSWMTDGEIGAALEALAHNYESKDQHYLATPLFLQALALYPTQDCHSVVLMNNLASSLAQQSPTAVQAVQAHARSQSINTSSAVSAPTRDDMLENARTWAQKALDVAARIQAPTRTEECDMGCAVAAHNLGEFAEMCNDLDLARQKYHQALSFAKEIGFREGIEASSARLKQVS